MNLCIIIPAYNESKALNSLIPSINDKSDLDIVVIDDGSTDGSGEIAKKMGATVITHEQKSGKGFSLKDGFKYALEHGYDGVLTMDGDGQHLAQDIDNFIKCPTIGKNCVIAGNRMNDLKNMPFVRRWVNRFMSGLISLVCHQSIPDTQCGFRFIGADVLKAVDLKCNDFEIETEILMKTRKKGFPIYSVDVTTVYRDEKSKINPVKDTLRFFAYFFKELFS